MLKDENFGETLAKTLKEERLKRGISHEKLSEKSGVSRPAISHIESGQRNPSMKVVFKLVQAMNMTMEEFSRKMEGKS